MAVVLARALMLVNAFMFVNAFAFVSAIMDMSAVTVIIFFGVLKLNVNLMRASRRIANDYGLDAVWFGLSAEAIVLRKFDFIISI
jgi:hypothetical protein